MARARRNETALPDLLEIGLAACRAIKLQAAI